MPQPHLTSSTDQGKHKYSKFSGHNTESNEVLLNRKYCLLDFNPMKLFEVFANSLLNTKKCTLNQLNGRLCHTTFFTSTIGLL